MEEYLQMATAGRSQKVDAYIAKSAPWAQPILRRIRSLIHKGCPQVEEVIKWGVPHFDYKGPIAGVAAFKQHVSFGFWKATLMRDPKKLFNDHRGASFAGIRMTSVDDLPDNETFVAYAREAVALNEQGKKLPRINAGKIPRSLTTPPPDFRAAMSRNKKAVAHFQAFSPSAKKEYVEWIKEAKQDATRASRIKTAVQWISEGKKRNWKYMPKK
jgi:hypothetical protein